MKAPVWLLALGVVVAAAVATNSSRTRGNVGPTPTELRASVLAGQDPGFNVPAVVAAGAARDGTMDAAARPAARLDEDAAVGVSDSQHDGEILSEQSPSPFVREWVRSLGRNPIPTIGPLPEKLRQFAAEPVDSISSTTIEARVMSEISQSTVAVVDRRVECRATACGVLLVYPFGTEQSAVADEIQRLTPSLGFPANEVAIFSWPRADGAPSALVIFRLLRETTTQSVAAQSSPG